MYGDNQNAVVKGKLGEEFVLERLKELFPDNFQSKPFAAKNGSSKWDVLYSVNGEKILGEVKTHKICYSMDGKPDYWLVDKNHFETYFADFKNRKEMYGIAGAYFYFVVAEVGKVFFLWGLKNSARYSTKPKIPRLQIISGEFL